MKDKITNDYCMNVYEIRMTLGMCIIFSLRMIGMFMVAPAINTAGFFLGDTNKVLIGFAIGIYGLMQAIFQIPFGFIADKIGYKKTIFIGLLVFLLGSLISSFSKSIWAFIFSRGLQGSAAISSVSLVFLSNCIREQNYTKSIACIGISFGISFLISIVFGPILTSLLGLNGLFKMISVCSIICMFIYTYYIFPYDTPILFKIKPRTLKDFFYVLKCYDILGYIFSVFFLHVLLTFSFIIIPKKIEFFGYLLSVHWKIYLIVILLSLVVALPVILYAEMKRYIRCVMIVSIILFIISELFFIISNNKFCIFFLGIQVFFIAFILSESFLPSLISKASPLEYKSLIMSIYSTSQFLGIALGGILGGMIYHFYNIKILCWFGILLSCVWLVMFFFISSPIYIISIFININEKLIYDQGFIKKLKIFPGIILFKYLIDRHILYLKINCEVTSKKKILHMIKDYLSKI